MTSNTEYLIYALHHFIERIDSMKNDADIRKGGRIIMLDIDNHIMRAKSAIAEIRQNENEETIKHHSTMINMSLNLWTKDLEKAMSVLSQNFSGANFSLYDAQKTIAKCNELLGIYCK